MKVYKLVKIFSFIVFLFSCLTLKTEEYIYPVAKFDGDELCIIYQTQYNHIELWMWDMQTNQTRKALLSHFTPAGIQVLPGKKAFSFICDDFIRIKHSDKRSPKRLDLYAGLYDFSLIHWTDQENCYLSAKIGENYGIYHVTTDSDVFPLVHKEHDCMYPQKIGNRLYYVERKDDNYRFLKEERCRIVSVDYPSVQTEKKEILNNEESYKKYVDMLWQTEDEYGNIWKKAKGENPKTIIDWTNKTISFLNMISNSEGYFLETPKIINRHDELIEFSYHQIKKDKNDTWTSLPLFEFFIPAQYLMPNSTARLYESILPFMPKYTKKGILFMDNNKNSASSVDIFFYNFSTSSVEQKTYGMKNPSDEHAFFSPIIVGNKIFYGGQIFPNESKGKESESLFFWEDGYRQIHLEVPYFEL